MKSNKIIDEGRIIELIITKNHNFFTLEQEEDEMNPTIRKISKT